MRSRITHERNAYGRIARAATAIGIAVLLSACASTERIDPGPPVDTPADPSSDPAGGIMLSEIDSPLACPPEPNGIDPASFEYLVAWDYQPAASLTELVDGADKSFVGCVEGWFAANTEGAGDEHDEAVVVLAVTVDRAMRGEGVERGATIYVSLPGGASIAPSSVMSHSHPMGSTARADVLAEALDEAIPAGTRVIVAGNDWTEPVYTIANPETGAAEPTPLIVPGPQGLLFEAAHHRVFGGAVPDDELAQLTAHAAEMAGFGDGRVQSDDSFEWLLTELAAKDAVR